VLILTPPSVWHTPHAYDESYREDRKLDYTGTRTPPCKIHTCTCVMCLTGRGLLSRAATARKMIGSADAASVRLYTPLPVRCTLGMYGVPYREGRV
jgi:hypothetical protein